MVVSARWVAPTRHDFSHVAVPEPAILAGSHGTVVRNSQSILPNPGTIIEHWAHMHIERIEIPAFRVLRDVSLDFNPAHKPQIFPIGSENGGGKSTLLQLVFVLLHCSTAQERIPYLRNLLASDCRSIESREQTIARLTISLDTKLHTLEFVSLDAGYLAQHLDGPPTYGFGTHDDHREARRALRAHERQIARMQEVQARYANLPPDQEIRPDSELVELGLRNKISLYRRPTAGALLTGLHAELLDLEETRANLKTRVDKLSADAERILGLLVSQNLHFITSYQPASGDRGQARALIARIEGRSVSEVAEILSQAAAKIFLLGPSNQQYLFLDRAARRDALITARRRGHDHPGRSGSRPRPQIEYLSRLDEVEDAMVGFYAYDWLSVSPLTKLFASARDRDFDTVVKTGDWGDSYTTLLREVNHLLLGKTVRPRADLSGVDFLVTDSAGQETALSPEDLSQGELKRLMIYAWLRASNAFEGVVLIDEIEASFHPDWQLGIVHDLQEWGPSNQYLLATHSYELCRALTPRHIRQLAPRLLKGENS